MKISYSWLKEYINTDLHPDEISRILTDCGLEVEATETFETIRGGLKGVVIGEVLSTVQHPNADKLTCCKVDVGDGNILDIVCGAPNVAKGQKVPVATIGTVIYKGEESFTIKAGKLRGEPSNGMICAEDELGLGTSHAGIMVLDSSAVPGTDAASYFNIVSDTIFEVAITPNRSDATSHIGVARDLVAAINNREKQHPTTALSFPSISEFKTDNTSLKISVRIENSEACARYSGITINNVKVQESPEWLSNRLKSIGLRPINNIVDITNYVLMETGQPLHAFDAAQVSGNQIIVKKLPADTLFVTLDGIERKLGSEDLMICNSIEPMCIAGVFGGEKSGVSEKTTSIFLESAYFDGTHVRKTSKLHNLKTDASFRFERGADPNMTIYALQRAAMLIKEIAGGDISSDIVDVYPSPIADRNIELSYQRINTLIGKQIPSDEIKSILKDLAIKIVSENAEGLAVAIPPFKTDVTREADVVEEILRIYGYNNIDFSHSVHSSLSYTRKPEPEKIHQKLSDFLSNIGFNEILTNSLTSSSYYEKSEIYPINNCVKILNPLSSELSVMRQTLLFTGLESLAYNLNRKMLNLKFYEIGTTYAFIPEQAQNVDVTKKYSEKKKLSLFVTGEQHAETWYKKAAKVDYHYLKSIAFTTLRKAGIPLHKLASEQNNVSLFTEGETFLLNNKPLLLVGKLNQSILKQFDIKQNVYYCEIDWNTMLREIKADQVKFAEISRYPEVRRDLALVLDKDVKFVDIEKLAYKNGKGILRAVNLFDVYEGEKIEAGKKSYAVSFKLQDDQKTLAESDIEKLMKRLAEVFEKELGAFIRR